MKKFEIKIILAIAIISVFGLARLIQAEEATTTYSLPPEIQAVIDQQANMKIETENFDVEFSPDHPGPNTKVSAQVISYTFDVNRSTIAWILDGKISGMGKIFSFNTGNLGSKTTLRVSIITPDQKALSKYFAFQTTEVDLLWETAGYAPAQYRGKILAVAQSSIKVAAFPQGFGVSSSQLIYEWKKNGKNIPDLSGRDKRTFAFYAQETGEEIIEVKVSTSDESAVADSAIRIKINSPEILFYEESSGGPQYQKELGSNFSLSKGEFSLRAEPMFFSKRALALANLSYEWQMNNKKIDRPEKPNLLKLSIPPETKSGSSLIKLFIQNPLNVLEMASRELQINFNMD